METSMKNETELLNNLDRMAIKAVEAKPGSASETSAIVRRRKDLIGLALVNPIIAVSALISASAVAKPGSNLDIENARAWDELWPSFSKAALHEGIIRAGREILSRAKREILPTPGKENQFCSKVSFTIFNYIRKTILEDLKNTNLENLGQTATNLVEYKLMTSLLFAEEAYSLFVTDDRLHPLSLSVWKKCLNYLSLLDRDEAYKVAERIIKTKTGIGEREIYSEALEMKQRLSKTPRRNKGRDKQKTPDAKPGPG